jgi:hypothetical protein
MLDSFDDVKDAETLKNQFIKVPFARTPGNGKHQKRDEIVLKNTCASIGHRNGLQLEGVAARQQKESDSGEEGDVENRESKRLRRRFEERN